MKKRFRKFINKAHKADRISVRENKELHVEMRKWYDDLKRNCGKAVKYKEIGYKSFANWQTTQTTRTEDYKYTVYLGAKLDFEISESRSVNIHN